MFFGSKCVKIIKMCILHIYKRADVNALSVIAHFLPPPKYFFYLIKSPLKSLPFESACAFSFFEINVHILFNFLLDKSYIARITF